MELEELLSKLEGVRRQSKGYAAKCPSHDDNVASLSVDAGKESNVVLHCHAGCQPADVMAAVGLTMADLRGEPHVVETYVYTDDAGRPLWHVERWANPKTFKCVPGLPPPAERRLYRAEALAWARERAEMVWYVEGEKDANRLASLGLVSTTCVGGADAWLEHYAEQITGCHLTVIADNDAPGRKFARTVGSSCTRTALTVAVVVPRYGKDVSDLLDLGWGLDALDPLPEEDNLGVVLASNVRTRPQEWVWDGYVPSGAVTMIEGDPGDGKSITTVDLSARWSTGAMLPDGVSHSGPHHVLLVSAEDDPESTIVPRLRAAGAALQRIHLVTYGSDPSKPFSFDTDMAQLARYVIEHGIKILIFDPLMAFIGDQTDSHNDHNVRRALYPLYRLARDTQSAVIVVRHLNKGSGRAIYRGGGSIAFIGAARAAYTLGRDPDDPGKRVLACVKMNVAEQPASLSFSVIASAIGPRIEWHGEIDVDVQTVLDGRRNSEDGEIVKFLNEVVADDPMSWKEITAAGADYGYTPKMLRNRRDRSRLMMITGSEGRRSVRWGYLDHATSHLPGLSHVPPIGPIGPCPLTGGGEALDPSAHDDPLTGQRHTGPMEEHGADPGSWKNDLQDPGDIDDEAYEEQRILELSQLPLECGLCGSVDVTRYAAPHWVVRCAAHNPTVYEG